MEKYNYNLTFASMIEEIFKTNGWYQGEDFGDGVYIQASIPSLLNLEKIMKNGISRLRVGTIRTISVSAWQIFMRSILVQAKAVSQMKNGKNYVMGIRRLLVKNMKFKEERKC